MLARILSAIVMVPIAVAAVWFGTPYFELLIIVVAVLAVFEWIGLVRQNAMTGSRISWAVLGVVYILFPSAVVVWFRGLDGVGQQITIWFFVIIWATDIGAYFAGRSIGGPKLAPSISPNKTWAGFIGGGILAVVLGLLLFKYSTISISTVNFVVITILISVTGQVGDLIESKVKRVFNVKDSGSLIPGHGGILDRIDAILFAAPVVGAIVYINQIGGLLWK